MFQDCEENNPSFPPPPPPPKKKKPQKNHTAKKKTKQIEKAKTQMQSARITGEETRVVDLLCLSFLLGLWEQAEAC